MKVLAIFVGTPQPTLYRGKEIMTGIYKSRVNGPVGVNALNIVGDKQADLTVHGGTFKAVYAYPALHYSFWKKKRPDLSFEPGKFGENLSVEGPLEKYTYIGDRFTIGNAELEVTQPRMPCFKLGIKMGDPKFIRNFLEANITGYYFKVIKEGSFQEGDSLIKIKESPYKLSIEEVARAYFLEPDNKSLLEKIIQSPDLIKDWKFYYTNKLMAID